ncbi:MAG: undecaprenyldiphospho-muramoylpentapeptide beta-N-acetylglucosaminyltransferase [Acidobacteriia bacterium 12-62-4]|nr:MAG: undecaprenyldiphospho-muramoylpentapeptide beta-N-acetylglucosaminyltransferase [Acidobacteriia bacterium 12-62-4]
MVFLMAGGGTGGHVIPGIAVARELQARGHEPVFVGTARGLETKLVPAAGFPLELIEIGSLQGQGRLRQMQTLLQLPVSVARCLALTRRLRVAGVFSMGGYAAGPVGVAAALRRLPLLLMEPNAMPGLTNRYMARFSRRSLVSFEEAVQYFPVGNAELTGLPVRKEFFTLPPKARGERLEILVTGGSRGARRLNEAVKGLAPWLAGQPVRVVLQAGAEAEDIPGVSVTPFINDMPGAFAAADLVICRAGAGAVAELAAAGKPAILVPYPYAADDHQAKNAQALERKGAARMIRDAECTPERLRAEITALLEPGVLDRMAAAVRTFARPGAAERAADLLEECAGVLKQ